MAPPPEEGKKRVSRAALRKAKKGGEPAKAAAAAVAAAPAQAKRKADTLVEPSPAKAAPRLAGGKKKKRRPVEAAAPAAVSEAGPKKKKLKRRQGAGDDGAAAAAPPTALGYTKPAKSSDWTPEVGPYAFNADPDDHCETDKEAYSHLVPVLKHLRRALRGGKELRIWDPYFCNGATVGNLADLGFPNVHNRNEDFYAVLASGKLPEHDVLMTSPPYSQDHIEKCIRHCAANERCYCLLLPNWVHSKDWFKALERAKPALRVDFCIGPATTEAYPYWFPKGSPRPDHVDGTGRTTPYKSSWHVHIPGAGEAEKVFKALEAEQRRQNKWVLAKTVRGLKWKAKGKAKRW